MHRIESAARLAMGSHLDNLNDGLGPIPPRRFQHRRAVPRPGFRVIFSLAAVVAWGLYYIG
jgi:hypothetical protein